MKLSSNEANILTVALIMITVLSFWLGWELRGERITRIQTSMSDVAVCIAYIDGASVRWFARADGMCYAADRPR